VQDIGKSALFTLASENGYQETAMNMDGGGTLEVVHRQPTTTAVDDLSRLLRWLEESTTEDLHKLARRQ
jgi:hypothetical protein